MQYTKPKLEIYGALADFTSYYNENGVEDRVYGRDNEVVLNGTGSTNACLVPQNSGQTC